MAANNKVQDALNQLSSALLGGDDVKPDLVLWTDDRLAVCGWRVETYLKLAGIPYTVKSVRLGKGEHKAEEFLKLNHRGAVPVLVDNTTGVTMAESHAIISYLAATYGKGALIPMQNAKSFAEYQQMFWRYMCCLYPKGFEIGSCLFGAPADEDKVKARFEEWKHWDQYLEGGKKWFLGDEFTLIDIALQDQVWCTELSGLDLEKAGLKNLAAWWKRIQELPVFEELNVKESHLAILKHAHPNGLPDYYAGLYPQQ